MLLLLYILTFSSEGLGPRVAELDAQSFLGEQHTTLIESTTIHEASFPDDTLKAFTGTHSVLARNMNTFLSGKVHYATLWIHGTSSSVERDKIKSRTSFPS